MVKKLEDFKINTTNLDKIVTQTWLDGCSKCRGLEEEKAIYKALGTTLRTATQFQKEEDKRLDIFKNKLLEAILK